MFWDRFVSLCAKRSTTPNAVANELGLSSGSVTAWKNGATPRATTIKKIADYFGVSITFFVGETDDPAQKNPAAQTGDGEREQLLSAIDRALFELTEEQKLEALRYVWSLQGKGEDND